MKKIKDKRLCELLLDYKPKKLIGSDDFVSIESFLKIRKIAIDLSYVVEATERNVLGDLYRFSNSTLEHCRKTMMTVKVLSNDNN